MYSQELSEYDKCLNDLITKKNLTFKKAEIFFATYPNFGVFNCHYRTKIKNFL